MPDSRQVIAGLISSYFGMLRGQDTYFQINKGLKRKFAEIEKLIHKNVTVRDFEAYLLNHEELLTRLSNIPAFKEDV